MARRGAAGLLGPIVAVWLVVLAAPASAAAAWGVEQPAEGARLNVPDPVTVVAFVDPHPSERVEEVEARFVRDGTVVGRRRSLQFASSEETGPGQRRTRWTGELDPLASQWLAGEPMPNGHYELEARAHLSVQDVPQEPTPWEGHEVIIDVDPPATRAEARVLDDEAREVELRWEPVALPDLTRYLVERAAHGEEFTEIAEVAADAEPVVTETLPGDGVYHYRVRVLRSAADHGERRSEWSEHASVTIGGPEPEESEPSEEPGGEGEAEGGATGAPPLVEPERAPAPEQPTARGTPQTEGRYAPTLDYGELPSPEPVPEPETVPPPPAAEGAEPHPLAAAAPESRSTLHIERELVPERVLVPIAAGLVLTVGSCHLWRLRGAA